ncbi:unnamed protein product [Cunninghamella echinulata]
MVIILNTYIMGRSAKFYKRPNKKEKEALNIKKVEQAINKKSQEEKKKQTTVQKAATAISNLMDIDTNGNNNNKKKDNENEAPDYVDLLTKKKTYKRIPKRK